VRGGIVLAGGRGGAAYTGRGPVCGTMSRRWGTMGLCAMGADFAAAGVAAGEASSPSFPGIGGDATAAASTGVDTAAVAASTSAAGVTAATSAGLGASVTGAAAGLSATGGATGALGGGNVTVAGGLATLCGVMNRGAAFGGSTGAAGAAPAATTGGLATELGGRCGTAEGGATLVRGGAAAAAAVGRGGAAGWAAFCVIAFKTSPGLEMCERSILGLNSSVAARLARLEGELPGSPCSA